MKFTNASPIALLLCLLAGLHFSHPAAAGPPGTVVAHSPKSSKVYLGSPSLVVLPEGHYIASHDLFGPGSGSDTLGTTRVYQSRDQGSSWEHISTIRGQFWSSLFHHKDALYILGTSKVYGDAVIRKSTDGGNTWSDPVDARSGKLREGRYHCAPMPVLHFKGRLWRAMEDGYGPVDTWGKRFRSMMMSAPEDADLLKASNWTWSNPLPWHQEYLNGAFGGWLEGNAVVAPDGQMVNILRADYRVGDVEKAAVITISEDGKEAEFDPATGFISFPGGCKKFAIRYDSVTGKYWTLSNYIPPRFAGGNVERTRNTQTLCHSEDLRHWYVAHIVLQHDDVEHHGFQYLDWHIEGADIIAVSRTAFDDGQGGADNQHNANYITFHRIEHFRNYSDAGRLYSGK